MAKAKGKGLQPLACCCVGKGPAFELGWESRLPFLRLAEGTSHGMGFLRE